MFYVFLAEGFEETEALAPVDVMRRAKLDVKTVGVTGECVTSSHGVPVKADITIDNIDLDDVQGVVLPGGMPGTLNLEANEKVIEAVKYSCENGKIVAAICAAPSILGHLGILDGKKATCFPGFEKGKVSSVQNIKKSEKAVLPKRSNSLTSPCRTLFWQVRNTKAVMCFLPLFHHRLRLTPRLFLKQR